MPSVQHGDVQRTWSSPCNVFFCCLCDEWTSPCSLDASDNALRAYTLHTIFFFHCSFHGASWQPSECFMQNVGFVICTDGRSKPSVVTRVLCAANSKRPATASKHEINVVFIHPSYKSSCKYDDKWTILDRRQSLFPTSIVCYCAINLSPCYRPTDILLFLRMQDNTQGDTLLINIQKQSEFF
jgi:hypothetical protein